MPKKRKGLTQVSLQVPDELLEAIHVARGDESANSFICGAAAKRAGVKYEPPPMGRPKAEPAAKRGAAKKSRKGKK